MARRVNLRLRRSSAFILDAEGIDKMLNALSPERRAPVLRKAMTEGAHFVKRNIRSVYKGLKPNSDLDKGIVAYVYPSGEGAIVRRFYIKGGAGKNYSGDNPLYRAYILNFLEKGAQNRVTKGKGKKFRWINKSRGSIPALKFFQRGRTKSKARFFKDTERMILTELAKQAREGK